jgi:DNA ligase-1
MSSTFKPLLACEAELDKIKYPVLVSPKLDGIRCTIHPTLGPVTRNLKPIANAALRARLAELPAYLDGELIAGPPNAPDAMQRTSSAVMSSSNDSSGVRFYAFDSALNPHDVFDERRWLAVSAAQCFEGLVEAVDQNEAEDASELMRIEEFYVNEGFEGVMLRDPKGRYKFGRSTVREGILLKVKRFADMEGTVVGFVERQHNGNEATKDNLGRTKRSSSKEGKTGTDTLGALSLEIEFHGQVIVLEVGTGFDDAERLYIWHHQDEYLGRRATFKYQPSGSKDAPRFPVFKAWREEGT